MAFVPLPVPPPEPVPVVKLPVGTPPKLAPRALTPDTTQVISVFAGNAGEGVHVKIVLPPLHAGEVGRKLVSMNIAVVAAGFIASLKVKTTAADGETPLAPLNGTVETMVGTA